MFKIDNFNLEWREWWRGVRQDKYEPSAVDRILKRKWREYEDGEILLVDLAYWPVKRPANAELARKIILLNHDREWFEEPQLEWYLENPIYWPSLEEVQCVAPVPMKGAVRCITRTDPRTDMADMMQAAVRLANKPLNHDITWMVFNDKYTPTLRMDEVGFYKFSSDAYKREKRKWESYKAYWTRIYLTSPPRSQKTPHLLQNGLMWDPRWFQLKGRIRTLGVLLDQLPSPRRLGFLRALCGDLILLVTPPFYPPVPKEFQFFVCERGNTGKPCIIQVDYLTVQGKQPGVLDGGRGDRDLPGVKEEKQIGAG